MRSLLVVLLLVAAGVGGCRRVVPPPTPEQAVFLADPAPLWIPRRVGAFHLAVYYPPQDDQEGTLYRFVGPDSVLLDVTLAPGPDLDTACTLDCARSQAQALQSQWESLWESEAEGHVGETPNLPATPNTPWRLAVGVDGRTEAEDGPRFAWRAFYVPQTRIEVQGRYTAGPVRSRAVAEFLHYVMFAFATPPLPLPDATPEALLAAVQGEWDYVGSALLCGPGRHRITVDGDSLLVVRTPQPSGDVDEERYRVVRAGPGILPALEHVIRLRKVNERERDAYGDLVAWDLVLAASDRYAWHRSDWYDDQRSVDVVRCDRGPY